MQFSGGQWATPAPERTRNTQVRKAKAVAALFLAQNIEPLTLAAQKVDDVWPVLFFVLRRAPKV